MKTFIPPIALIISLLFLLVSCNKDCESCSCPTPQLEVFGSWTTLQSDAQGLQYNVELRFNTDYSYDWILLDSVQGHTNSHADIELDGDIMRIVLDTDCTSIGIYSLMIKSDKLSIIAKEDACGPRATALEYVWKRK
ncbi:hypothetical protein ACFLRY_02275 [Bacteroidota bacterium]